MIEKIEEFYKALLEYEEYTYDAISLAVGGTEDYSFKFREALGGSISSLRKARSINQLYFPHIEFNKDEFYKLSTRFVPFIQEHYEMGGNEGLNNAMEQAFTEVGRKIEGLETQLQSEMLKYRH